MIKYGKCKYEENRNAYIEIEDVQNSDCENGNYYTKGGIAKCNYRDNNHLKCPRNECPIWFSQPSDYSL